MGFYCAENSNTFTNHHWLKLFSLRKMGKKADTAQRNLTHISPSTTPFAFISDTQVGVQISGSHRFLVLKFLPLVTCSST